MFLLHLHNFSMNVHHFQVIFLIDLDIGEISRSSSRPCWNPASHGCTRAPSWSSLGHYIRMVPFPITVGNEELFVVYFSIPELKKNVRFLLVTGILRGGGPIESTPGIMFFFRGFFTTSWPEFFQVPLR